MFKEHHVIQYILHCLMANIKQRSAPTAACVVRLGTEQYQSTNCL